MLVALTDKQLAKLKAAASLIPPGRRDAFLRFIAAEFVSASPRADRSALFRAVITEATRRFSNPPADQRDQPPASVQPEA